MRRSQSACGQEIAAARPLENLKAGDPVNIALRPEIIALDGATGDGNRLSGAVKDITFLGSIVRIRVRFKENIVSFDTFNNPHLSLPQRGQSVTLTFSREAVLAMGAPSRFTA